MISAELVMDQLLVTVLPAMKHLFWMETHVNVMITIFLTLLIECIITKSIAKHAITHGSIFFKYVIKL